MTDPLFSLVLAAIALVVIVLVVGLVGFAAGGEFNRKYGNKLMRLRILFQAIAVGLVLIYIYLRNQSGV